MESEKCVLHHVSWFAPCALTDAVCCPLSRTELRVADHWKTNCTEARRRIAVRDDTRPKVEEVAVECRSFMLEIYSEDIEVLTKLIGMSLRRSWFKLSRSEHFYDQRGLRYIATMKLF